jgi:cytoskeletal protein CcmA (bactofilin family)
VFGKKGPVNPEKIESLIGKSMIVEGKIISENSIRVEGTVKGEIVAQGDVFIGENGKVLGNITARSILIAGKLTGNVRSDGRLDITRTGSLEGDIETQILIIAEGAEFRGQCFMGSTKAESLGNNKT